VKKIIIIVVATAILAGGIGFFSGMEYKAYQIRSALQQAFKTPTATPTNPQTTQSPTSAITNSNSILAQAQQEGDKTIFKKIGDEITLATQVIKINSATETQTLSGGLGNPEVAPSGSMYVVVNMTVTNTTKSSYNFDPQSGYVLIDDKKREFSAQTSIGNIDNYLDERALQPSIPETGVIVYLIPSDAISYSINQLKGGVKELYQITLK
jgi:hypothetical protein